MRQLLCVGLAVAATLSPTLAADAAAPWRAAAHRALDLLHDGRFDEADELLFHVPEVSRDDPAVCFFRSFVTYWRLLYDSKDPDLQSEFDQRLRRVLSVGEARLKRNPDDGDAALWTGSARLLRAELLALRKKPLAGAFAARRAHRDLLLTKRLQPDSAEADFALGTYNYFASQAPALVKGLRFLLALPGGGREEGLSQLERAARESVWFRLEARLLLASIYAGRHEREYDLAVREAQLADEVEAGRVAVLHAAANIDLSLGRWDVATRRLDRALAKLQSTPRSSPDVRSALRFHRARADLGAFRPDLALERLRPLLKQPIPAGLRKELEKTIVVASCLAGQPAPDPALDAPQGCRNGGAWHKARPFLAGAVEDTETPERTRALLKLVEDDPADPVLALLAGRALLLEGKGREALAYLRKASSSPSLPSPWRGPALLLAGEASDLAGLRDAAVRFYRKAIRVHGYFIQRGAAYLYRARPFALGDLRGEVRDPDETG